MKHDGEITNAVLSCDDQFMASAIGNRVLLWEMGDKPKLKYTFDYSQRVACLRFSADNLVIFSGSDGGKIQGRNVLNGEPVGEEIWEDGAIVSVDLEPDGKRLLAATANGTARVWQPPPRYPISDYFIHAGAIESMEVSPDGRLLLTGSADGKARCWDLSGDKASVRQLPHGSAVLSTTFSADGKYILTGGADAKVRVWLTSSGEPVGQPLLHGLSGPLTDSQHRADRGYYEVGDAQGG